jgi:membrane protein required for colicin V production
MLSVQFSGVLAPYITDREPLNRFIAMLIIYLACSLVIWGIFRLVSNFIDRLKMREWDRQMGALVGFVKGGLLCIAITFFALSLTADDTRKMIMTSRSGYYIGYTIDRAQAVMPDEIHDVLHPYLDKLDQQLEHDHVHIPRPGDAQHDAHEGETDHDDDHQLEVVVPVSIPWPGE